MRKGICFFIIILLSLPLILISCHTTEVDVSAMKEDVTIVSPSDATAPNINQTVVVSSSSY